MSRVIIYLGRPSPNGSSSLPGSRRAALRSLFGLASSGVYMCPPCYQRGGSLLHCLSTLTCRRMRFISVALSLKSPSAAVSSYPCPAEPGLSSWAAFRRCPRGCPAYLQASIISHLETDVNSIEMFTFIVYNNVC